MQTHDEQLSDYIDGRLPAAEKTALENRLRDDAAFAAEYRSLQSVKNVLRSRQDRLRAPAPVDVRHTVLLSLEQEWMRSSTLERISQESHNEKRMNTAQVRTSQQIQRSPIFRTRPQIFTLMWQRPYAIVVLLAVLVLGWVAVRFSLQTNNNPSSETSQNKILSALPQDLYESVFVKESLQNYRAVRSGQITLQCKTASFETLDKFFHEKGVHYNIVHPKINAQLLGGVVSEENGKKSAHLVFKHGETLLYMWEIDLDEKTVRHASIHSEAWALLRKGERLWDTKTDTSTTVVFWEDEKKGHRTLCSVVSALPRTNLQPLFQ